MKYKEQFYWPETVIFLGAGATASLGIQMTSGIGDSLYKLSDEYANKSLRERVKEVFSHAESDVQKSIENLLIVLDYNNRVDEETYKASCYELGLSRKRLKELQTIYDWEAVKKIIRRCPRNKENKINLQDLYNLIDMNIQSGTGLYVDAEFIRPERLLPARNTLNMLTSLIHAEGYRNLINNNMSTYEQYYGFARILAKLMQEEGIERVEKYPIDSRRFYMFSYAVISMNWDPIFLWLLFNAHREKNNSGEVPHIGNPPAPMKLFHDLAHFMAVRKIDGDNPSHWFPMNETAVQRLNDPEHVTSRRVRVGKFYFPHGCHGFRECPNCGKLTFYLGSKWKLDSPDLFPPQIIKSLAYPDMARSEEEMRAYEEGKYDAIQCTHCGEITEAHHSAIIMQTNFKGQHPPFIEEIQRDMKVAIEKAKHIIFFGYSLPEDDFIYRSILASRKRMGIESPKVSVVVGKDAEAEDKWLKGDELENYTENYPESGFSTVVKRAIDILGKENLRGYAAGIPNVFLKEKHADEKKVIELLRWE
ncbi:hypothetical protein [Caldibacillus thermoamylovorans]|uniref:hypothetical protein n=2 Tax=Bacillaceae TaxID=186817 RepID=UPI00203AAF36|nr:hypothetical protein [Caldibacillus thermoamylovorans]MCM3056218.1 hypothetical protein [Caldibacillus thermoamylovorans]